MENGRGVIGRAGGMIDKYTTVSKGASVLHLVIAIATMPLSSVALQLLQPYLTIGEMMLVTAPLTCSIAFLSGMLIAGSLKENTPWEIFAMIVLVVALPYGIAAYFDLLGGPSVFESGFGTDSFLSRVQGPGKAGVLLISIFSHYFSMYGLPRTIASLACGVYLGWVVVTKILPRFRTS